MKKSYKLTQERFEKLKEELYYLKTVREKEVADQIKEARSFGDLSENSEYDEAKNEQGKLYSRIAELEDVIAKAEIIEDTTGTDQVSTGRRVLLKNLDTGETEEYHIVGSQEANPVEGRISDESPVGRGLVGHKVGEEVAIQAPAALLRFSILEIG